MPTRGRSTEAHDSHFVAYHNSEKFGRYRVPKGRNAKQNHWTLKSFREDTLLRQTIWVFEGVGSPRKYSLMTVGTITGVAKEGGRSKASLVHFKIASKFNPIDVTYAGWFKELLKQQQSFRNGLNRIQDKQIIKALQRLVGSKGRVSNRTSPLKKRAPIRNVSRLFEALVTPTQNKEILRSLSRAIETANEEAPTKWGIRINQQSIMIKVGFVEVLQVGKDWFHQLVRADSSLKPLRNDPSISFTREPYANAPNCDTCNFETSRLARLYPRLSKAHEAAIRVAALSPRHTTTAKDHSHELVEFLSGMIGRPLPQPAYFGNDSENLAAQNTKYLTVSDYEEGRVLQVLSNRYERNPMARKRCIEHYGIDCFVCGVSLADQYGPEVAGLIHVHHLKAISEIGRQSAVNPIRDLRPVCPNCHAVIHSTDPHQSIREMKAKLRRRENAKGARSLPA